MADFPVELTDELGQRLSRILDVEGKIPRALEALGPVAGRDVVLLDQADGLRAQQLRELGARISIAGRVTTGFDVANDSADVVIGFWSTFRGAAPDELATAERALRPGGRLLVVHDYGRDDVSHLRGDRPEYGAWSRRSGPFLSNGFRVHVVHCFWTFETMAECAEFLAAGFGQAGLAVVAALKRPRLSYNIAIYHRTFGQADVGAGAGLEVEGKRAGGAMGAIPSGLLAGDARDSAGPVAPTEATG